MAPLGSGPVLLQAVLHGLVHDTLNEGRVQDGTGIRTAGSGVTLDALVDPGHAHEQQDRHQPGQRETDPAPTRPSATLLLLEELQSAQRLRPKARLETCSCPR